jgi:nucleotide-binding universal stress UspA family protein
MRILIPLIDSANLLAAVRYTIREFRVGEPLEVHLLHVRSRVSLPRRADDALRLARALLERFHVSCTVHSETGDRARTILAYARRLDVERIVLGTARHWSVTRLAEDSVVEKVMHSAPVPVSVVAGRSVSPLERYALPAGAAGLAALLLTE